MVELIISSFLLMLLVTLIFSMYVNSHRAWKKTAEHQEVMGDLQVTVGFLTQELQSAPFDSLSIDSDQAAISFLTNNDENGQAVFAEDGRPLWHHWLLYYAQGDELLRRKVLWTAPDLNREFPTPLEVFGGQPLASYRNGEGRALSQQLVEFRVENPSDSRLVDYTLRVHRKGDVNKIITLEGAISPRN